MTKKIRDIDTNICHSHRAKKSSSFVTIGIDPLNNQIEVRLNIVSITLILILLKCSKQF